MKKEPIQTRGKRIVLSKNAIVKLKVSELISLQGGFAKDTVTVK